ncbi:hypothetical protein [Rhodococcus sp. NPDC057529]|uniref:hypothetical protein n=1 Tax=Rhodococcus sp. NPDC057529 TaxID=3346158 RepID=UPI0036729964
MASLLHDDVGTDAQRLLADYLSPQYGPDPRDVRAAGASAIEWLAGVLNTGGNTAADFYEAVR